MIDPVPCPRPRVARNGGVFYPKAYTAYRRTLRDAVREAWGSGRAPIESVIRMVLRFGFARPRTGKLLLPRPDIDNLVKAVLDAIQPGKDWGGAMKDDTLVAKIDASKTYVEAGDAPHVSFRMEW